MLVQIIILLEQFPSQKKVNKCKSKFLNGYKNLFIIDGSSIQLNIKFPTE